jgi:potassium/chloride transporter 4/5/6
VQTLLALFYPSVTGVMAGSNRSAMLRDPQASIPVGTLSAIALTSTLYLVSVLLYGSVASREYLLSERLMSAKVAWPAEEVVSLGITLSTLGAGLQSLVRLRHLSHANLGGISATLICIQTTVYDHATFLEWDDFMTR